MDGKVYVRKSKCKTCIFGANRLAGITQERVDGMVREADAAESCIPCHSHMHEGAEIEPVCRGYFDRKSSMALRMAEAFDVIEWVS
jgi:hypothetical protein